MSREGKELPAGETSGSGSFREGSGAAVAGEIGRKRIYIAKVIGP